MSITPRQIEWAAGFLEGEGYFGKSGSRSPEISAAQVQRWPLDKLQTIFGGTVRPGSPVKNQKPYFLWRIGSTKAAGIMMTLYSLMSPKRQERMREAILAWQAQDVHQSERTHCPVGHEYNEWNTYLAISPEGAIRPHGTRNRQCRQCNRNKKIVLRARERWERKGYLTPSAAIRAEVVSGR